MSSFDSPNPHRVSNFYSPPRFPPPIVPIPPTAGKQRQHITINHPSMSQRFNPSCTPRQAARITLYPTPRLFLPDLETSAFTHTTTYTLSTTESPVLGLPFHSTGGFFFPLLRSREVNSHSISVWHRFKGHRNRRCRRLEEYRRLGKGGNRF